MSSIVKELTLLSILPNKMGVRTPRYWKDPAMLKGIRIWEIYGGENSPCP